MRYYLPVVTILLLLPAGGAVGASASSNLRSISRRRFATSNPLYLSRGGGNRKISNASASRTANPPTMSSKESLPDVLKDLIEDHPSILDSFRSVFGLYWNHLLPMVAPFLVPVYGVLGLTMLNLLNPNATILKVLIIVGSLTVVMSQLYLVLGTLFFVCFRKQPLLAAQDILKDRIRSGRAIRLPCGSDVFLPRNRKRHKRTGMILFPGALIHHSAYAPIASKLSDKGIPVIVQSLEPTRFVADVKSNKNAALLSIAQSGLHEDVDEWVLAGHSAGATTVYNLATQDMVPACFAKKIVMWGHGRNEFGHKGRSLRESPHQVLVLNASEDGIVNGISTKARQDFENSVPPSSENNANGGKTTYATIKGGNHAGFADYGTQWKDGKLTIPLKKQHSQVVRTTANFVQKKIPKSR